MYIIFLRQRRNFRLSLKVRRTIIRRSLSSGRPLRVTATSEIICSLPFMECAGREKKSAPRRFSVNPVTLNILYITKSCRTLSNSRANRFVQMSYTRSGLVGSAVITDNYQSTSDYFQFLKFYTYLFLLKIKNIFFTFPNHRLGRKIRNIYARAFSGYSRRIKWALLFFLCSLFIQCSLGVPSAIIFSHFLCEFWEFFVGILSS